MNHEWNTFNKKKSNVYCLRCGESYPNSEDCVPAEDTKLKMNHCSNNDIMDKMLELEKKIDNIAKAKK